MNIGTAWAIFHKIDDPDISLEDKGTAIYEVCKMETHNSVRKAAMLKVIWWLLHLVFDFHEENEETEENKNA